MSFVRYDEPTGDQYVVTCPAGREYVRRGTSPTSLGDPEPSGRVLTTNATPSVD